MNQLRSQSLRLRDRMVPAIALLGILALLTLALVGPSGVLAVADLTESLNQRQQQIASLRQEQAVLQNWVNLLEPGNVDPDFASQLVRGNLNVAHPEEYVVELDQEP